MSDKEDTYRTIDSISEGLYKEKGSKFYGFVHPCSDKLQAKEIINAYRKEHHNAVHVCFAWRFGHNEPYEDRYSDDGEPNNSAGKPIFGQIISFDLTNVLIAVVRYYGGTNLGVGGLINAYRTSANEALSKASIKNKFVSDYFKLNYEYSNTGDIMFILNKFGAVIEKQDFEDNLPLIRFNIRKGMSDSLIHEFEKFKTIKIKHLKSK